MRATPPRARIDKWQEAQPAPAPARTETAGPPAPSRTAAAPRRTPVLTGRVVHGRSGDAKGHAFRGRVLAIARDDAHQNGNGLRPRYLVDDSGKPAPVWVTSTDIEWPPRPVGPGDPVIGYVVAAPDDSCSTSSATATAAERASRGPGSGTRSSRSMPAGRARSWSPTYEGSAGRSWTSRR